MIFVMFLVTAATQRMRAPARRWHSLCLLGKAETEAPMQGRINTGAPEGLMQRWGRCPETGEIVERRKVELRPVGKCGGVFFVFFAELPVSDFVHTRRFQPGLAALVKSVTSLVKWRSSTAPHRQCKLSFSFSPRSYGHCGNDQMKHQLAFAGK